MKIPTVEDRVEDIRRRAALLAYVFQIQQQIAETSSDIAPDVDSNVFDALRDYANGIIAATKAIDRAEEGSANPDAPDVYEKLDVDDEDGGAR